MKTFTIDYLGDFETLTEKTKLLYKAFEQGKNIEESFSSIFEIDFRLVFGTQNPMSALFKLLDIYYKNEAYIKKTFFDKVLSKNSHISYYELPIENSRIDIFSVGKESIAYEIKTKYDSMVRLSKQILDYSKCFEYVYVICPSCMVKEILKTIPDYCGIFVYDDKRRSPGYHKFRVAKKSPNLDKTSMVSNMFLKEKNDSFKTADESSITNNYSFSQIDSSFKEAIKERYRLKYQALFA